MTARLTLAATGPERVAIVSSLPVCLGRLFLRINAVVDGWIGKMQCARATILVPSDEARTKFEVSVVRFERRSSGPFIRIQPSTGCHFCGHSVAIVSHRHRETQDRRETKAIINNYNSYYNYRHSLDYPHNRRFSIIASALEWLLHHPHQHAHNILCCQHGRCAHGCAAYSRRSR